MADVLALAGKAGFVDVGDLVVRVASLGDLGPEAIRRKLGLSAGEVRDLLADRGFRKRLSEVLVLGVLSPEREVEIASGMVTAALEEEELRDRLAAAKWLYQQGGVAADEKRVVEHTGAAVVRFVLDPGAAEAHQGSGFGHRPPDPLAGAQGARVLEVEADSDD